MSDEKVVSNPNTTNSKFVVKPPEPKKPVPVQQSRQELGNLQKLRKTINDTTKTNTTQRVGAYGKTNRISTGILEVDIIAGVNADGTAGIPVGSPTILVGIESSGKTTMSLRIAGNGQKLCSHCYRPAKNLQEVEAVDENGEKILSDEGEPQWVLTGECDCYAKGIYKPRLKRDATKAEIAQYEASLEALQQNSYRPFQVVFIDAEDSFTPRWASRYMYPRCVEIVKPGSAEEAIDIYVQYVSSGLVDMIIFDSLAEAAPETEVVESAEKSQQGLQARLLNKFARRATATALMSGVEGRPVTQIWIQQWREKLGIVYGDNRVMPGGKGQKYAAAVIIDLSPSAFEEVPDPRYEGTVSKDDCPTVKAFCTITARCMKNKTAEPHRTARYQLRLSDYGEWKAGDVNNMGGLLKMLASPKIGLVAKESQTKWTVKQGTQVHTFQRKGDLESYIIDNRVIFEQELLRALAQMKMDPKGKASESQE